MIKTAKDTGTIFWLILAIGVSVAAVVPSQPEEAKDARLISTPDIVQRDPEGRYPDDGEYFCGPCAAANALIWLGAQGFERLLPQSSSSKIQQRMLVSLLGSSRYMQTAEKKQTSPAALNEGIQEYIEDCGYSIQKLEILNFKPSETADEVMPDVTQTFEEGLRPRSVCVIHIGWHKYNKDKDEYTRFTGHYVTVVGFGRDRNGTPDDRIVIIHDPWNGKQDDYVKLEKLKSGNLIVDKDGQQFSYPLQGAYKLAGEICIYEKADVGLLEHVHIFELADSKNSAPTRLSNVPIPPDSQTEERNSPIPTSVPGVRNLAIRAIAR
jgi:hypothetical protein